MTDGDGSNGSQTPDKETRLQVFLPTKYGSGGGWEPLSEESDDNKDAEEARKWLQDALTDALNRDNLCVLLGAGASAPVGLPTMEALGKKICNEIGSSGNDTFEKIKKRIPSNEDGFDVEEFLSICKTIVDLDYRYGDIINDKISVEDIRQLSDLIESKIVEHVNTPLCSADRNLAPHRKLLFWLCGRSVNKERARLFTTNYDLCVEEVSVAHNIVLIDGFSRSVEQQYDRDHFRLDIVRRSPDTTRITLAPNVLHLYKLHGSIDWFRDEKGRILRKPLGAGETQADGSNSTLQENENAGHAPALERVLIYPRSSKYQQAFEPPFLDMFAAWQDALRRENTALIVIGYSFRDNHVSAAIKAALESNLSFRLIVVDPTLATRADPARERAAAENETETSPVSKQGEPARSGVLDWIFELAGSGDRRITLVSGGFEAFVEQLPEPQGKTELEILRELIRRADSTQGEHRDEAR